MDKRKRVILGALAATLLLVAPASADNGKGNGKGGRPEPTWAEVYGSPTLTLSAAEPISAVDIAVTTGDATAVTTTTSSQCWTVDAMFSKSGWWGYWEFGQRTNWCHNGSYVTYRYTSALPARAGGACGVSQGTWYYKNGGGVGQWYVDVRAGASFSCFVGWNSGSPWYEIRYAQGGSNWQVAGSDG
jgi:hypothetical protein